MSERSRLYESGANPLYPFTIGDQCHREKYMYGVFADSSWGIGTSARTTCERDFIASYTGGGSFQTAFNASAGHASIMTNATNPPKTIR